MSIGEETSRQTQNTCRDYISHLALEHTSDPPNGAGGLGWGEEYQGYRA